MTRRTAIALSLLLAGLALAAAGVVTGDWRDAADVMTYGDFDAPPTDGQAGVMYLAPGVADRAVEKVYRFDGPVELHPLVAMGALFALLLAWARVRNREARRTRRWLVQWLGFVGTRLGVLRVAGVLPVPRCAAGVVPLLNCQACEMADAACPIGALQGALRHRDVPLLAVGAVVASGALAGRWFCGWLCPFGFLEDLVGRFSRRRLRLPRWLAWGGFVALGAVVVAPLALGLAGVDTVFPFCATACPSGTVLGLAPYYLTTARAEVGALLAAPSEHVGGLLIVVGHAALTLAWAGLVLAAVGRVFCRFGCPLGAALGLFNDAALVRVEGDPAICAGCHECRDRCPMGDAYTGVDFLARSACVRCGRCVTACPHGNRRWVIGAGEVGTLADGGRTGRAGEGNDVAT